MNLTNSNWDAVSFFENLTAANKLAAENNFVFCRVSGLDGFEEALDSMQSSTAFLCVSDIANGYTELNNTPRTRRIKTVFLAMRHAIDDMDARQECMDTMRELFRQLMTRLILEKTRIEQNCIYLDSRITFNEIDRFFAAGCACAYFQIAVDVFTDLQLDKTLWKDYTGALWLLTTGTSKIETMRYIDKIVQDLYKAQNIINNVPSLVIENITYEEFETHKTALNELGADVEFRY